MGTINWFMIAGCYGFDLRSSGDLLLKSETYASKPALLEGIAALQRYAVDRRFFHSEKMPDGTVTFVLLSSNGNVLGRSGVFADREAMENGIRRVMGAAPIALVREASMLNPSWMLSKFPG